MNYLTITIVAVVVILLLVFLIRQNNRDKKNLERQIEGSELKPEKHKKEDEKF
ncbi:hypothetical protein MUY27_07280 [Mucilaginibacter sp. RS28]|uniref:Uncharacterized protein n=1 Tax=Mucilaginibacter straminoryzae TaxID=2932774 RepID=A0A9X2B8I8_9SPHI|nr:hypothetical protein [Mucilaginibacter straminoryzae]MCJ8209506.1 hypothetical protein [Mucilaginibacter straminoryzae]